MTTPKDAPVARAWRRPEITVIPDVLPSSMVNGTDPKIKPFAEIENENMVYENSMGEYSFGGPFAVPGQGFAGPS